MCTETKAKVLLVTFNFLFWAAGVAMLVIGIWMKVDAQVATDYLASLTGSEDSHYLVSSVAIFFITFGTFAVFVGFLGLCGAYNEKMTMLTLYSCILIIFVIAELSAVIILVVYWNKKLGEEELKKVIGNDMFYKSSTESIWNHVQSKLHCCGIFGFSDYRNSSWWNSVKMKRNHSVVETAVPNSCCVKTAAADSTSSFSSPEDHQLKNRTRCQMDALKGVKTNVYLNTETCVSAVQKWIKGHTLVMVVLAVGIFAFELIGATAACCLCLLLRREASTKEDR